jgi:predicted transposase/invertase (TIGR01784 family)
MHDRWYKKIFSDPGVVEDLLRSFVKEDFVKSLDFSTLRKLNNSFISPSFKKREADVIYEIHSNNEIQYIYILLEFQSTVDHFMALRMARYVFEFYQEVLKLNKKKRVNPVFPILIYNGDAKWTAPEQFSELLEKSSLPAKYLPEFRYFKIAINEIPKRELVKIKNAVSTLFYLENSSPEDIINNKKELISLLKAVFLKEGSEIVQVLFDWIYSKNKLSGQVEKIISIESLTEATSMLEAAVKRHNNKIKEISMQQGMQQGMLQGMQQGAMQTALQVARRMLERDMSPSLIHKITSLPLKKISELKKEIDEKKIVEKKAKGKKMVEAKGKKMVKEKD